MRLFAVSRRVSARRPTQQGFTLIELLVVIAVLAILAAIVIFNVVGVANKGTNSSACTDQKSVQTAVDAALNDGVAIAPDGSGNMTPADWNNLVPTYLHTGPPGSGLAGAPATYGNIAPTWTLTSTGPNGGWTVQNHINNC
jgi:prepilin-type N-terminal cleavage/methylation domain-containing protein